MSVIKRVKHDIKILIKQKHTLASKFISTGHFYKVNVPVMVTQAPGCQHIPSDANPSQVEQRNVPSVVQNIPSQVPPLCSQILSIPQVPKLPLHTEHQIQPESPLVPRDSTVPVTSELKSQSLPETPGEFTLDGIDFNLPVDMSTPTSLSAEQILENAGNAEQKATADMINTEETLSHFLPDLEGTSDGAIKVEM